MPNVCWNISPRTKTGKPIASVVVTVTSTSQNEKRDRRDEPGEEPDDELDRERGHCELDRVGQLLDDDVVHAAVPRKESPRSPCTAAPAHFTYWTGSGWSSP